MSDSRDLAEIELFGEPQRVLDVIEAIRSVEKSCSSLVSLTVFLFIAGRRHAEIPVADVYDAVSFSEASVRQYLRRLEGDGLIEIRSMGADRRNRAILATAKMSSKLQRIADVAVRRRSRERPRPSDLR